MHESSLIKNMLKVIDQVRRDNDVRPVEKITIELSRFGTIDEEHFQFHFNEEVKGTDLENVRINFKKVPFGVEARLVSVTLRNN
jgi:Zn finger protein HypA/HybF involved in hydrogenase expression